MTVASVRLPFDGDVRGDARDKEGRWYKMKIEQRGGGDG